MSQISVASTIDDWSARVPHEVGFWQQWIATRGLQYTDDFNLRLSNETQVSEFIKEFLPETGDCEILDVGAGPLTVLGKMNGAARLRITACDPLAPIYDSLLLESAVDPIVRTEQAFAEDLSVFYDLNRFSLVHCRNALDHSMDPVRGLEEMLLVTAPGGHVILEHLRNEGEENVYEGLHQWNFDVEDGRFIIWGKHSKTFVDDLIYPNTVEKIQVTDRMIGVAIKKRTMSDLGVAYKRMRSRAKQMMYNKT